MNIGTIIVAVSNTGIIGIDNRIPWYHPADMKRFRLRTTGGTIIMGRKTFESIGKALPKRRNVVISSQPVAIEGIETFRTLTEALQTCDGQAVWFIGGKGIYTEAMQFCQEIDLTIVPDTVKRTGDIVDFPWIDPTVFRVNETIRDEENNLTHVRYAKIKD